MALRKCPLRKCPLRKCPLRKWVVTTSRRSLQISTLNGDVLGIGRVLEQHQQQNNGGSSQRLDDEAKSNKLFCFLQQHQVESGNILELVKARQQRS
ncbi:hypothetical protein GPALN_004892 [Globodera pallida]|nr:hypothetical protein GPALN_004892 [Globodera pallida]